MSNNDRLRQHYADIFATEPAADLLQLIAELDEAAQRCRAGEPSVAVDQAIEQLAQQRRRAAPTNSLNNLVEFTTPIQTSEPAPLPARLRPGWYRQWLGMVAAIAVLVVVAGILAVMFSTMRQRQQPIAGNGTAVPSLPLSATAHGVAITLGLVDSTTSATRFNLNVQLPAYLAGQQVSGVLGPSADNNVRIAGMIAAPGDPVVTETDSLSGQNMALSLSYQSAFRTDHDVTLTIQKLWLPPKPTDPATVQISPQALAGPWTFTITPEMVKSQPSPTPVGAAGRVTGISATEAGKLAGFPIIEPTQLPASLIRKPFSITTYRVGASLSGAANFVEIYYPARPPSTAQGVLLVETTDKAAVPLITGETASIISPLAPNGRPRTMTIVRGSETRMDIGRVLVTRFDVADANSRQTYFVWTHHGVSSFIEVIMSSQNTDTLVSDVELQQIVSSMIKQRHDPPLIPERVLSWVLSVLRGLILASILIAIYRARHSLPIAWVIFAIVALFTAFLFVDGIVTGPWFADIGFVIGGALALGAVALSDRWRRRPIS